MPPSKPGQKKGGTDYKSFVASHGGKSTKELARKWQNRFGSGSDTGEDARNAGGAQDVGNEGIAAPGFDLPRALQPPVGGAPPTPPDTTGDIPTAQPPSPAAGPEVGSEVASPEVPTGPAPEVGSIGAAMSDFLGGGGAPSADPGAGTENPAVQMPGDPAGSYRAFEGAPPQQGPTTAAVQEIEQEQRDPALDLLLQKFKGAAG